MPKPEDVRPSKFPNPSVVYNDDIEGFAVADGLWESTDPHLAVRWNGEGTDPGYPKLFNHPTWLLLPENLSVPLLRALLDSDDLPGVRKDAVLKALQKRMS